MLHGERCYTDLVQCFFIKKNSDELFSRLIYKSHYKPCGGYSYYRWPFYNIRTFRLKIDAWLEGLGRYISSRVFVNKRSFVLLSKIIQKLNEVTKDDEVTKDSFQTRRSHFSLALSLNDKKLCLSASQLSTGTVSGVRGILIREIMNDRGIVSHSFRDWSSVFVQFP